MAFPSGPDGLPHNAAPQLDWTGKTGHENTPDVGK